MPRNGFLRLGVLDNLDNVKTGFGYSTSSDGTGYSGPFLSIEEYKSIMQLKLDHYGGALFFRAYDEVNSVWKSWKQIVTK